MCCLGRRIIQDFSHKFGKKPDKKISVTSLEKKPDKKVEVTSLKKEAAS